MHERTYIVDEKIKKSDSGRREERTLTNESSDEKTTGIRWAVVNSQGAW